MTKKELPTAAKPDWLQQAIKIKSWKIKLKILVVPPFCVLKNTYQITENKINNQVASSALLTFSFLFFMKLFIGWILGCTKELDKPCYMGFVHLDHTYNWFPSTSIIKESTFPIFHQPFLYFTNCNLNCEPTFPIFHRLQCTGKMDQART